MEYAEHTSSEYVIYTMCEVACCAYQFLVLYALGESGNHTFLV